MHERDGWGTKTRARAQEPGTFHTSEYKEINRQTDRKKERQTDRKKDRRPRQGWLLKKKKKKKKKRKKKAPVYTSICEPKRKRNKDRRELREPTTEPENRQSRPRVPL